MQNPFYHELSFTWNWWYLVFAISVVAMFFIGFNSVRVNPRNGRICWVRYSERGWYILAVMLFIITHPFSSQSQKLSRKMAHCLLSATLTVMISPLVTRESLLGIIQVLDNIILRDPSESPVWCLISAPVVLVVLLFVIGSVYYLSINVGAATKANQLRKLCAKN